MVYVDLILDYFIPVKPYIIGEGLQNMIIKKGQVITFDIKYGGEPEPEVKWVKVEEVCVFCFIVICYTLSMPITMVLFQPYTLHLLHLQRRISILSTT